MKVLIIFTAIILSGLAFSAEPTRDLKNHIVKITLEKNNTYRLELRESAAAYHAEEKFLSCLQKAMKENKEATLKVAAYSLNVLDCKN